ncbi:geranylgeranyl reductase family protein [Methanobrevibacter sp.]|uniref:geranylgeranyl reductase family protein n=1 Tax=Methanobrevibacter sp. TaxID=66852 RepID=UPI003890A886
MNFDYDVVIIGGGPVGSTIAYYLSSNDLSVCIIEKKTQIGFPLQCAGILSNHIFELNELPENIILNRVKGAFLHTRNRILNIEKDETVAYIIDRVAYDDFLFNKALKNNVDFINQKAIDFDFEKGIVFLQNNQEIKSKIIVGCDGYKSGVSNKMGNVQKNFNASQMLVKIDEDNINKFRSSDSECADFVDAYMFEEIVPGFLWLIPLKNNLYRVGLFSDDSHKKQNEFLEDFLNENFEYEIVEKYKGFIPIFNDKNNMVYSRALLIGDAAAQVKPTSGGGLLIAFDACKMASRWIVEAIATDNIKILKEYQKEFNKKYSREFNYQFKVQKAFKIFSDDDLDYLFLKLKENDGEYLVSEYGDMDTQSTLVKEVIKRGLIFKIVPSFLFKKVGKIFGLR